MHVVPRLALLVLALAAASCSKTAEQQSIDLSTYVDKHRVGSTQDYFLVKTNAAGDKERIALIYGLVPDYEFCMETARMHMDRHPGTRYSCEAAN